MRRPLTIASLAFLIALLPGCGEQPGAGKPKASSAVPLVAAFTVAEQEIDDLKAVLAPSEARRWSMPGCARPARS